VVVLGFLRTVFGKPGVRLEGPPSAGEEEVRLVFAWLYQYVSAALLGLQVGQR
jgi:hypothetical protein